MRLLLITLVFLACSASKEDKVLKQASEIHNDAMEIGHKTSLRISYLKKNESGLARAHQDSLQSITLALGEWYEMVVEVPGYEHEDNGHDHDHAHGDQMEHLEHLSAMEILEIQTELKKEIERLQASVMGLSIAIQKETKKSIQNEE